MENSDFDWADLKGAGQLQLGRGIDEARFRSAAMR